MSLEESIALVRAARWSEALPGFERALRARPNLASALHNRARALVGLGRFAEARTDLEAALATQPEMVSALTLLASVLATQADPAGAERGYRSAFQLHPSWRSFQPKSRGKLAQRKSALLEAFSALSQRPGVRLLDLPYNDTQLECDEFKRGGGKLDRIEELDLFNDIDGVLAAIEACDLVVTTSNVTAHWPSVEVVTAPELDSWDKALARIDGLLAS